MSVLLMLVTRDARSPMVRVVSVTLRSIATPLETSTTPRYIVTISGKIIANSTAEMPRRSRTKLTKRWMISVDLMTRHSTTSTAIGLVAERGRGDQQLLVARHVVQVEQRHVDGPLIIQADQHDGA